MPKASNSVIPYLLSWGNTVVLAYATGWEVPSSGICSNTAPNPSPLASVWSTNGLLKSGYTSTVAEVSRSCSFWNDCHEGYFFTHEGEMQSLQNQTQTFDSSYRVQWILWQPCPKGIPSILIEFGRTPSIEIMCPRSSTTGSANWHFWGTLSVVQTCL